MINLGSMKVAGLLPNGLVRTRGRARGKSLYLTFDDGPHPDYTLKVCDLLAQYSALGTFFFIGRNIKRHPDIAREVVARGHLVCNHSDRHRSMNKLSRASQVKEVEDCQTRIRHLNRDAEKIFRAPRGRLYPGTLYWLKRQGWEVVHWSYDSLDYQNMPLPRTLEQFDRHPVRNGEILLFHDDNQLACDILERLLPRWAEQGYSFPTVAT